MALTFDPEFVAICLLLEIRVVSLEVLDLKLHLVTGPPLLDEHIFEVFIPRLLKGQLRMHRVSIALQLAQLLPERVLVVFCAGDGALEFGLVVLLVAADGLECLQLFVNLVTLRCTLIVVLVQLFKLTCDMVDVPLQCHDFLDEIFFFFVGFSNLICGSTDVFLCILQLHVDFFVFY